MKHPKKTPQDQASVRERTGRQLRGDMVTARAGVLDRDGMRALALKHPTQFMARFEDMVARREITMGTVGSLRGLFQALNDVMVETVAEIGGVEIRTTTSAFPLAMGSLMVAALNDSYAAVPSVMDELVTDMESNKKFTHIAKLQHQVHGAIDVAEGADFPLISAGESFHVIGNKRRGFRWRVTQETLDEDDVGVTDMFLRDAGEYAAELNEERGLDKVTDQFSDVYRPNGAATALFSSTANTPGTQAPTGTMVASNAIVDASNLERMRAVLVAQTNTRGRRIGVPLNSEGILLVPDALAGVVSTITGSENTPGEDNAKNPWGPKGLYQPRVLSTPKLDDLSTSQAYMGFPKRIFIRKWKLRVETVSVIRDQLEFLRNRCAYEARVAWDMEIGARDYVGWVKSKATA